MSGVEGTNHDDGKMLCCAGCGSKEDDDIKLTKCNGCHLVRYCGVKCQREHRPQHKEECEKRAAELRDEVLFKHPDSSDVEDCPICSLPLPIDRFKSTMIMPCCGKLVCDGCFVFNLKREADGGLDRKCPFCRTAMPRSDRTQSEYKHWVRSNLMKRVEANDPVSTCYMGGMYREEGDYKNAFKYFSKAAALGDVNAHYNLSFMYHDGKCVEKDEKKRVYHLEEAAIGGHAYARHNLGRVEESHGKMDRAVKHWIIAANLGSDKSLKTLKNAYRKGLVSKEDFASALRAQKAAVDARKSPQREEIAKHNENRKKGVSDHRINWSVR